MLLFLLLSVPLVYLVLYTLLSGQFLSRKYTLRPYILGMLWFLPSYFALFFLKKILPLSYTNLILYFHFFLNNIIFPIALMIGGYFLIHRSFTTKTVREWLLELLAFFCGFFTIFAVVSVFENVKFFSSYTLFLQPIINISSIIFFAAIIILTSDYRINIILLLILSSVAFVFYLGLIPYLFSINYHLFSILLAGLALILSLIVFFVVNMSFFTERKRYIEI